ncbi:MAG: NAD-dependent epimerase/dehydratase family protein [Pirellulales bacterium]
MSRGCVLVTGSTGMVGFRTVQRAVEAGYRVRAMVRPTSDRALFDGMDVKLFEADMAIPESLPPALEDVDFVVHAGAHVGDWGPAETYRAINVFALEHMLTAAEHAGRLKRWIQISSLGIYPARHHYGTDETEQADIEGLDGYTRTKAEAEVVLRRHMDAYQFPAVILRPGFVYGPLDRHVVPRLINRIASGKMRLIGDGEKVINNLYVGNLVDAVLLAMEREAMVGETFNLRDQRLVTRNEYIGTIADYLGKPMPRKVPEWVARTLATVVETVAHARGATHAPMLTKARIKFLTLNLDFSIAKAESLLGYHPQVDFREGMREALDWATSSGRIPRINGPRRP